MKKILFVALSVAAFATFADTWSDNPWVYNPVTDGRLLSDDTYWAVYDARGNTATLVYKNGVLDQQSLDNAISSLKLSVNSVFSTMAGMAQDIISIDADLARMDRSLQDLSGKLNNTFAEIMLRLNELEIKDKDGNSTTMKRQSSTDSKTVYVVDHFLGGGAQADMKSLSTNNTGKIQIYGFESIGSTSGMMPYSANGSVSWFWPWNKADDSSIKIDLDSSNTPSKSGNKHGIHIAGWYTPESTPYLCQETIGGNLSDIRADDTHYVLTKKFAGSDAGNVHYMKIGKLAASVNPDNVTIATNEVPSHMGQASIKGFYANSTIDGMVPVKRNGALSWELTGSAIKITGTQGSPVVFGSGSTTNNLTFATADDSNVKVTVSGDHENVTVTFGVYYK